MSLKGYDRFRSTAILLLRNPFESLVSAKAEQDPYLDGSVLSGPLWETEVRQKTYTWLYRARTWICAAQSLHLLHYEHFRKETRKGTYFTSHTKNIDCIYELLHFLNILFIYLSRFRRIDYIS